MAPLRPLTNQELKIMAVVWDEGGQTSAKRIHEVLSKQGFERASTYQYIHRCISKGALSRTEPGFICTALIAREETQVEETRKLVDTLFGGSAEKLLVALVDPDAASPEEIDRLRSMVNKAFEPDGSNERL